MLRVSWVGRKTNESILEEIGKKREMLRMIRIRQLGFLGHILRKEALENLSLTGKIARSRGRGRPRKKYMDGNKKNTPGGSSTWEILQMIRDRREWKSMNANGFSDTARRYGMRTLWGKLFLKLAKDVSTTGFFSRLGCSH